MAKKKWHRVPQAPGTRAKVFIGHEPWALRHEPWAMSHEQVIINNRLINELFDDILYVLDIPPKNQIPFIGNGNVLGFSVS